MKDIEKKIKELREEIKKLEDTNVKSKLDYDTFKKQHEKGNIAWDITSDLLRIERGIKENEKQIAKYNREIWKLEKKRINRKAGNV